MIRFCVIALVTTTFLFAPAVQAEKAFHPSRVLLLIYGGLDLNENARLELRFIPAGNLIGDLAPVSYFGVKFEEPDWFGVETLGVEIYVGHRFKTSDPTISDESLFSFTLNPHYNSRLYAWTEIDLGIASFDGYYFAQLDYKLLNWLHTGLESEGWGNYEEGKSWSHGGGGNLLFRFKQVGLDTAVHIRKIEDSIKPEFLMLVHLFL